MNFEKLAAAAKKDLETLVDPVGLQRSALTMVAAGETNARHMRETAARMAGAVELRAELQAQDFARDHSRGLFEIAAGGPAKAVEMEAQILSVGDDFLPYFALAVREEREEPGVEYWDFLREQVAKMGHE